MRILLGWLLLLSLFATAGIYHSRWTDGVRRERDRLARARGGIWDGGTLATTGRAWLVIGRPSGAAPVEVRGWGARRAGDGPVTELHDEPELEVQDPPAEPGWSEAEPPPDWIPPVYEMTVQAGQVLSVICEEFYGTQRAPIPQRVAEFNGLASPDSVRAGQTLLLPPLAEILGVDG